MVEKKYTSHFPFGFILFIVFLVLKLCGVISWSWWWVCAPVWMPVALVLIMFIVGCIVIVIKVLNNKK